MSMHQQFARVWLVTMVVTFSAYFVTVIALGDGTLWTQIGAFGATVFVQVSVIAIASAMIKLKYKDGLTDEHRERTIDARATRIAYNVLMYGMILVGCVMPFIYSGWKLFHIAVFVIAVAEIVRYGSIVSIYRRERAV